MNHSDLLKIADANFWYKIDDLCKEWGKDGGVYKLIGVSNGKRAVINRLLGADDQGVLYIGMAKTFLNRVIELKKSILREYSSSSHDCGVLYKNHSGINSRFAEQDLYVELWPSERPELLESEFIRNYTNTFGEVPPMNSLGSKPK